MATKNEALLIATRNAHKTSEFREIFGARYQVDDLSSYPDLPDVNESGSTFDENSALKAVEISQALPNFLVLADDSGVYPARYSGPDASDASNRLLLIESLATTGARGKARSARFRCVLTLAHAGTVIHQSSGSVEGIIANEEKGDHGFGYDSLFIPEGYCQTFAQLPSETKHAMSHRGRAVATMRALMQKDGLL